MFTKEELMLLQQALALSSVQGSAARKVADLLDKLATLIEETKEP